jgi:ketosteroid isomerase-like protein
MESENVQILRRLEQLFNSRDLDSYLELFDPAVEWHASPEDPDASVHRGREAVRAFVEGWIDAFGDLQTHMEEVSESGDRITTVIRFTGSGSGSAMPLRERVGFIWTLRGGRVTKVEDLGRDI